MVNRSPVGQQSFNSGTTLCALSITKGTASALETNGAPADLSDTA